MVRERYGSREHPGLDAIVRAFRQVHGQAIVGACFGVAGPVVGGHVATPNLAWDVDASVIARELDQPQVGLINDLEANAHGIFTLEDKDFAVLNAGAAGATGNIAVISAGTGLGEAGMYWDGAQHHPFAGEGGHCDYAPHADLEMDLLRYLQGKFGAHVSWERVLSGPGLANIYAFLRDTGRGTEPDWLAAAIRAGDGPAVISRAALEGKSELCVKALDVFVDGVRRRGVQPRAQADGLRRRLPGRRHRAADRGQAQGPRVHGGLHRQGTAPAAARDDSRAGDHERRYRASRRRPLCGIARRADPAPRALMARPSARAIPGMNRRQSRRVSISRG